MELTKERLSWIKENKMLALVILQMVALGYLFTVYTTHLSTDIEKEEKKSLQKDDIIKLYREAYIQTQQLEQNSRHLNDTGAFKKY